jgi:asparagine synthase (glutamine-hydrolysing)
VTAIAGLWRLDGRPDAAEACGRMLGPLAMYGRDDLGAWDGGDVALGRRLQRVLPEDAFDRQPLRGRGGVVLVADVRLDNRGELGDALGLTAERLRGLSDAAVLLAAYERWETESFDRLAGDYACAVWDGARRRLVLARDPTGRRPLCYHRAGALFAFASLPAGLHALPEIPREVDEARVAAFLLAPKSGADGLFKGVESLGGGQFVVVDRRGARTDRHWRPQPGAVRLPTADDYVEAAREQLDRAVAARLRGVSDVAAHLSAGLDSSGVAATAARLLAATGGRVHAFTAIPRAGYDDGGFSGRLVDEGPLAAAVAAMHPNIEHALIETGGRSPLASLERNLQLYQQPVPNLCNLVWLDAIHAAARDRGLGVLLSGAMGNFGLSYAGAALLPELIVAGQWGRWLTEGRAMVAGGARWRGVLANTCGPWLPAPLWRVARLLSGSAASDAARFTLVRPEFRRAFSGRVERLGVGVSDRPRRDAFGERLALLQGAAAVTQKGVLAEWGVDVRDPTADRRLLDFCLGLPTDQFLRDGQMRALAKRALADRLPPAVLAAPRRGLQAADWHEGLTADRARLGREVARIEACPAAARVLDLPRMRRLLETWPEGGWDRWPVTEAYRGALLHAVSAGHFIRRVAEEQR